MMASGVPQGAKIVKEELNNEAGVKMNETKKSSKFSEFIDTMKKAEQESIKPLSQDYEVIENISSGDLEKMQKDKRLVGYDPKTNTAMVLKISFVEKKKKLENKK